MSKVILITGISSGLGKFTAEYLVDLNYKVYGTSRNEMDVKKGIYLLKTDITDDQSVVNTVQIVVEKEGRIDVLINNAGYGVGGPVEFHSTEEAMLQIDTNLMGTFRMCKAILPVMRKQNYGTIINISSIGGLMGLPFQGFYSASKFAIEGLTESLRYETRKFNVNMVLVNPGDFKTKFTANRKSISAMSAENAYSSQYHKSIAIIEKDETVLGCEPTILAKKIACIIEKKNPATRYIVASFEQKLAVWLKYILPEKLFFRIIGSHYGV
jgi:NAD(P)-dependent dehydrogenase (short-subunit alcohol dehydrogenase family)